MKPKKGAKDDVKMWSYKLTYDTMFAPNPLHGFLTLATCKPRIRQSPNSKKGTWIAGWTACTLHNSPLLNDKVEYCKRGEEKLIYLAQIDEVLTLDEYWEKYPQKRPSNLQDKNSASYYGDNIYHKDSNGEIIQAKNSGDHGEECKHRDYEYGKNALICKKFFYFAPDKRLSIPAEFDELRHGGVGQSLKSVEKVDQFIKYVTNAAAKEGVINGIVGNINVHYDKDSGIEEITLNNNVTNINSTQNCKKKGCGK